jgi:galactarate dehydratase
MGVAPLGGRRDTRNIETQRIRRVSRMFGRPAVARDIFGKYVPSTVPGADLEKIDMARVTGDDWAELRKLARGYCRTVDASRSRKRTDGSATVVRDGYAPYGTDDVSDDVTQDAVLLFARRLAKIMVTCETASVSVQTREADSWQYVTKEGQTMVADRTTIRRWAVRDAAARNGLRLDDRPDKTDATPGAQTMSGTAHAEHLATACHLARHSETIFRMAWGDGSDFPTLRDVVARGAAADDLGRAGIFAGAAQARYGGAYGSRRNVRKIRDAASGEWRELSARLDEARDTLVYRGARARETA